MRAIHHFGRRAVQASFSYPIDQRARSYRASVTTRPDLINVSSTRRIQRRVLFGSALSVPFIRTTRADTIKLRVSLDTSPSHGRTLSIADFLKKLAAASQGQIAPRLFDSGQLFPDRDVIKAMVLGQVEMAA